MSFGRTVKRKTRSTSTKKSKPSARRVGTPFKNYQRRGVKFLVQNNFAGLLWAPGLGKTRTTLEAFHRVKQAGYIDRLFIFAKRRICYLVWPKEIKKWGYDYKYRILHGADKKPFNKDDADIYIINYDGIEWFKNTAIRHGLGGKSWLVLDESSKVKNTSTIRFKSFRKIVAMFARRTILTGSPVPNGLHDIFGQIYILDRGAALGEYITSFRNEYFKPAGYMGYGYALLPGADKLIYKAIKPLVLRYGKELLELPPLVPVYHEFDLPDKAAAIYKSIEKDFVALVSKGLIRAANAGVASGILRQVVNGGVYLKSSAWEADVLESFMDLLERSKGDKVSKLKIGAKLYELTPKSMRGSKNKNKVWEHIHDEKTETLREIVDELGGDPCLVAYEFNHDLERLLTEFPDTPFINGKTSEKDSIRIERDWNAGKLPLVFGHPESIAHGLNLQESGSNIVWYGLPWNLENYEQLIQRLWRQGQKNRVFVHHILARNTVDEVILNVLKKKDKTQQDFLDAMEERLNVKFKR